MTKGGNDWSGLVSASSPLNSGAKSNVYQQELKEAQSQLAYLEKENKKFLEIIIKHSKGEPSAIVFSSERPSNKLSDLQRSPQAFSVASPQKNVP